MRIGLVPHFHAADGVRGARSVVLHFSGSFSFHFTLKSPPQVNQKVRNAPSRTDRSGMRRSQTSFYIQYTNTSRESHHSCSFWLFFHQFHRHANSTSPSEGISCIHNDREERAATEMPSSSGLFLTATLHHRAMMHDAERRKKMTARS